MGDPVCYMHLLDEDGRMPEPVIPEAALDDPSAEAEREAQPAAERRDGP